MPPNDLPILTDLLAIPPAETPLWWSQRHTLWRFHLSSDINSCGWGYQPLMIMMIFCTGQHIQHAVLVIQQLIRPAFSLKSVPLFLSKWTGELLWLNTRRTLTHSWHNYILSAIAKANWGVCCPKKKSGWDISVCLFLKGNLAEDCMQLPYKRIYCPWSSASLWGSRSHTVSPFSPRMYEQCHKHVCVHAITHLATNPHVIKHQNICRLCPITSPLWFHNRCFHLLLNLPLYSKLLMWACLQIGYTYINQINSSSMSISFETWPEMVGIPHIHQLHNSQRWLNLSKL